MNELVIALFAGGILTLGVGLWASVRGIQAYDRVSQAVWVALGRSDDLQAKRDNRLAESIRQLESAYSKAIAHATGQAETTAPLGEPPPRKTFVERFMEQEEQRGNGRPRRTERTVPDEIE